MRHLERPLATVPPRAPTLESDDRMSEANGFEQLRQVVQAEGASAALSGLAERFREDGNYPGVFEARLMAKRLELGLPAIHQAALEFPSEKIRKQYEQAQIEAARETGRLFLDAGDIYRAWPYFRALGETEPIRQAIERAEPGENDVDGLVEIAYHEQVHPRRGFELILEHYGTCRAITNFPHYPAEEGKVESARLLVDQLSAELRENLQRTIASVEKETPESDSIADLVEGRDWLFEGNAYYVDTSHVSSIVQMAPEWTDEETLRQVVELTQYGRRLGEMYQFKTDPPFDDLYPDTGIYLRALLGEDVDAAVEHFRKKIPAEGDPFGNVPAQVLVKLLVRVGRIAEAAEVACEHLVDADPNHLICPTPMELCVQAGDGERLARLAEQRGDLLAYAAALGLESR